MAPYPFIAIVRGYDTSHSLEGQIYDGGVLDIAKDLNYAIESPPLRRQFQINGTIQCPDNRALIIGHRPLKLQKAAATID